MSREKIIKLIDENDPRKRECIATFVRASPEFLTFATHALLRLHFRQLKFIIRNGKNRLHAAMHFQSEVV